MSSFEIYVFVLCLIVFLLLTGVFTAMLTVIVKQSLKLIRKGIEDESVWTEYIKEKKRSNKRGVGEILLSAVFYCVILLVFAFSLFVNIASNKPTGDLPVPRVVMSNSMSKKYEGNKYLFENKLGGQFNAFDMIVTHKLPKEKDLKLYDIVVYEVDGELVVHRIVQIEEPNEKHPNERYFRLQGDNVHVADKFPVKYSQMRAIYRGDKLPLIGSFVVFMQSPAGYLCVLLVIVGMVVVPIVEKKLDDEKRKRAELILKNKVVELRRKKAEKAAKKAPANPEKTAKTKVRDIPLNATLPPVYPVLLPPPPPPMAIPVAVVQIKACEKKKEEKEERVHREVIECDE